MQRQQLSGLANFLVGVFASRGKRSCHDWTCSEGRMVATAQSHGPRLEKPSRTNVPKPYKPGILFFLVCKLSSRVNSDCATFAQRITR